MRKRVWLRTRNLCASRRPADEARFHAVPHTASRWSLPWPSQFQRAARRARPGPGETPPAKTATSSQLPSPTGSPNRLDTATPSPTLATASNAGSPTASKPHPASLTGTPQGLVHGLVVLVSKCGNQPSPGTCSQQRSPTASTIQALDSSSHVVAQTRSETNGEYSIRLAGGHYTLHAIVNPTIECDTDVEVPAGGTLTTQIDCDENIP